MNLLDIIRIYKKPSVGDGPRPFGLPYWNLTQTSKTRARLLDLRILHHIPLHQRTGRENCILHPDISTGRKLDSGSQSGNLHTLMLPDDNEA